MTLEHEAIYIPKSLGCVKLPRTNIGQVLPALSLLTAAKVGYHFLMY